MLTYVINTSENKTFDSDQLFKLVGYNKICWMNYSLDEMEKCAEEICERQTVLGADDFRIAILVDFYGFDRVRNFYGTDGYAPIERGVDLSLYFPYIEAYIVDHLFFAIRKKELVVKERHIFYIQNGKHEGFNVVSNEVKQLSYILEPDENSLTGVTTVKVPLEQLEQEKKELDERAAAERVISEQERQEYREDFQKRMEEYAQLREDLADEKVKKKIIDEQKKKEELLQQEADALEAKQLKEEAERNKEECFVDVPKKCYSTFKLHCTETLSLDFTMKDYPYTNKAGLTFDEFYRAFKQRESQHYGIKRHHYYASFGSGKAKAAFDNLSLSLYLIKMYEREERIMETDEVVIGRINPDNLKDMLITSWNKICSARTIALNNSSKYYDIKQFGVNEEGRKRADKEKSAIKDHAIEARKEIKGASAEDIYAKICQITKESTDGMTSEDKAEMDKLVKEYLRERDNTKESSDDVEFENTKEDCKKIDQCPSRNDYEVVVGKKKEKIAQVLRDTMSVEYSNKDYTEKRKEADEAFAEYTQAKRSMGKNIMVDVAIWLLSMVIMMVPFMAISGFDFSSVTMYVLTAATLTGLFILSFLIRVLPLITKMNSAKAKLTRDYIECRKQQRAAMVGYELRYKEELIEIEHLRYEIRNITRLYNYNLAKNKNIEQHRQMLEIVENKLSAMLNNLGVEPVVVRYRDLSEEFNVNKSYMSNENRVYKIFSIDTIENLFDRKEG